MNTPLVSIVIPTFNRAACLNACITRILAAQSKCIEIIVSDNASTDNTQAVVAKFRHINFFRYYQSNVNLGSRANILKATSLAIGTYVFWLSDDDLIEHDSLEYLESILTKWPSLAYVFGPQRTFDSRTGDLYSEISLGSANIFFCPSILTLETISKFTNVFSGNVLRRDLIDFNAWKGWIDNAYPSLLIAGDVVSKGASLYVSKPLYEHYWFNVVFWEEFGSNVHEIALRTSSDYKESFLILSNKYPLSYGRIKKQIAWRHRSLNDYLHKPYGFRSLLRIKSFQAFCMFFRTYRPTIVEFVILSYWLLRNAHWYSGNAFNKIRILLIRFFLR